MNSDVRAAVKQFIDIRDNGGLLVEYSLLSENIRDAMLAEFDETPVDEAWLHDSFQCDTCTSSSEAFSSRWKGASLVFYKDDGRWPLLVFNCSNIKNPTRGQLRTLCRALGIQLKEQA